VNSLERIHNALSSLDKWLLGLNLIVTENYKMAKAKAAPVKKPKAPMKPGKYKIC
jgi:hypothetical protein